jgi:putative protein kinase ArgK-like GTPase of G3E family
VQELAVALQAHRSWLDASGELHRRRRQRLKERVRDEVARMLLATVWVEQGGAQLLEENLAGLETGTVTPYEVAARIVHAAAARGVSSVRTASPSPPRSS